jgi:hypothetical protein
MKSTPERLAYSVDEAAIVTGKTSKAIRVLISRNQFPYRRRAPERVEMGAKMTGVLPFSTILHIDPILHI